MANPGEVVGVLVLLEFVVLSSILLLLFPLQAAAPAIPLLVFFLVVLFLYFRSRGG